MAGLCNGQGMCSLRAQSETEGISDNLNTSPITRQVQGIGYLAPYEIRRPTENTKSRPVRDT